MNKDIIKSYKSKKLKSNLWLIALSLVCALSINFALSNSKIWNYLKTSVNEASIKNENNSDLYMTKLISWPNIEIEIKSNKDIYEAKNLAFSFFYNNEDIKIKDIMTNLDQAKLNKMLDYDWTKTINIIFDSSKNIKSGDTIASIFLEKNTKSIENLNLLNTNFTDKDNNIYYLTSSSIEF